MAVLIDESLTCSLGVIEGAYDRDNRRLWHGDFAILVARVGVRLPNSARPAFNEDDVAVCRQQVRSEGWIAFAALRPDDRTRPDRRRCHRRGRQRQKRLALGNGHRQLAELGGPPPIPGTRNGLE
jgi:hypothetical protein